MAGYGQYQRDPVAVQFDGAARKLLARAHANPGKWAGTYLANPDAAWDRWARRNRIRLLGADPVPGELARTRWARGFVRALYYQHQWYYYAGRGVEPGDRHVVPERATALRVQVGTVKITSRGVVRGRLVRAMIVPGGREAIRAVRAMPARKRIYDPSGEPGERWANPANRDW